MKSVLMVAYWFPPEGNAAVYRPLRFLRNLAGNGWRARVVSGQAQFERFDPDLLRQLPDSTEVVRVAGEDWWQALQRSRGERLNGRVAALPPRIATPAPAHTGSHWRSRARAAVRRAESWWYQPDMQQPWIAPAVRASLALCEQERPDVLWVTGPPWSAFLAVQEVSRRTGVPYVLDFRTSWTVVPSPFEARRPQWAQRRDRRLLRQLLAGAQSVVFFYKAEAECFWRMYRDVLAPSRIHVIPNGFDGEVEPYAAAAGPRFTILYTGTLSDYGFEGFLTAMDTLLRSDPALRGSLSVQFVGEEDQTFVERVRELELDDVISVRPPVPHAEVQQLQRCAHALLMLERKPAHKGYELLAGAKLFGYLKAGKPILGIVPHGEAERVLREVGVRTIAEASSVQDIVGSIETLLANWRSGSLGALIPDPDMCERYSGRSQTRGLARALEGLPAVDPFVPGSLDVAPSLKAEFAAAGWA